MNWTEKGFKSLGFNDLWVDTEGTIYIELDEHLRRLETIAMEHLDARGITAEIRQQAREKANDIEFGVMSEKTFEEPTTPTQINWGRKTQNVDKYMRGLGIVKEKNTVKPETAIVEVVERPLIPTSIVRPIVAVDEVLDAWKQFQNLKRKLWTDADYNDIKGNKVPGKSAWRKIKTAFGVSIEILSSAREEFINNEQKEYRWSYRVRARAPNGAFADAEQSCSSDEEFAIKGTIVPEGTDGSRKAWKEKKNEWGWYLPKPESTIRGMAQTRAFNRAISDLVGGGEVSAEELN